MELTDPSQSKVILSPLFTNSLRSSSDSAESIILSNQSSKWLTLTSLDDYWKLKQSYQVKVSKISDDSVFIEIIKETKNDFVEQSTLPRTLFRGHQLAVGDFFVVEYYERIYAIMIQVHPRGNIAIKDV